MEDFDDVVQEFLVESYENLDQLDQDLVALERDPTARDRLASVFRTIHTIKGTSGFLAFSKLEQVTHAGESLLARLRDGAQVLDRRGADVLLRVVDVVRALLAQIERDGQEGDMELGDVIAEVEACIAGAPAPAKPAQEPVAEAAPAADAPAPVAEQAPVAEAAPAETAPAAPAQPETPEAATPAPAEETASRRGVADTSVRVDVDLLDKLMRLVGELVLTRNQMVRATEHNGDHTLSRAAQRLNLITSELQEGVMKTRMQPISHLWSKLPRVVRDLSNSIGRQVRLELEGAETELDRSLLEAVKDPLTHLVRNAVDHGLESPEDRVKAGKSPEGTLTLRAYHEHGHVVVEVADDGKGVDPKLIGATAVKRGLLTAEQVAAMDADEVLRLVFRAGFSTAAKVSNVSGRGVGMDVVRTNLEAIGGAVDLRSVVGKGTTWRLTIPLTLAIVQALIVESANERYVLPQMSVRELVSVEGQTSARIEYVSGAPVCRLRGRLLPLVRLNEALGGAPERPEENGEAIYIAVLNGEGHEFGLVVDRVLTTEEVVVKPLASHLKDVGCYAGATILGDGRVSLILDVLALARNAHLGNAERAAAAAAALAAEAVKVESRDRLLVTRVSDRRVAIPLSMVTRLEEFPVQAVERVGSREVVQYRGQILPVLRLSGLLGSWSEDVSDTVPAVVYSSGGHSVALAVDGILDIVDDTAPHGPSDGDGLSGSTVIDDKVTELLDMRRAIMAADPDFELPEYETRDSFVEAS
ncbi:two-component system chemotaxis sensor kinase CheA [Actinokineospora baliensis]|uniref:chemotaxis protein CheW n=1 Tax=Actinokineospora baliensis TaxID=547056 RepID=UPI0019584615|nr:chemotaxis protein CheW [Actinokineospora baliensis]MBM7773304.1 two-component system chemotaxis sensor kinase CheA [Actinokineospora baliensis]